LKIVATLSLLSEAMDDVEDKHENRYERLSRLTGMFEPVGRYVREFSPELGKSSTGTRSRTKQLIQTSKRSPD
jgi:hypothetical protein